MIYKTTSKYLRVSPRKLRFLFPEIRGKKTSYLLEELTLSPEKGSRLILKSLRSAISAAKSKDAFEEELIVKNILVDEGPRLKRRLIKPRGRADLIKKRMSHLTIVLKDKRKRREKKIDETKKI